MKKKRFNRLLASAREAAAIARGEVDIDEYRVFIPAKLNVKSIRKRMQLTQTEFALRFGFNVGRLRDWEQGRTHPDMASRAYLLVIDRNPKAVRDALAA